jgi:hypothetical protein
MVPVELRQLIVLLPELAVRLPKLPGVLRQCIVLLPELVVLLPELVVLLRRMSIVPGTGWPVCFRLPVLPDGR